MSELQEKELVPLLEYSEGQDVKIQFSPEEKDIIYSEFKGKIEIVYSSTGTRLKAFEHVGSIILPNHVVRIKPKISDANFMSMIIHALRLPEIGVGSLPALEHQDFYYIIMRYLISYLDDLFRKGLYRGYVAKSENMNYVRGKIELTKHILYNQKRNDRIFCSFSEITVDTLENRIIKFTLYYLLQQFLIDDETRMEILSLYKKFYNVGNVKSVNRNIFSSITYTPLNDHYRTILSLCEFVLKDSSLDIENMGEKSALSFLVNMENLFQKFIAKLLTDEFGESNIDLQRTRYFDSGDQLQEISDIQLTHGKVSIILDTKYKEKKQLVPDADHVRQVYCYSRIAGSKKCGLIYASNRQIPVKQYYLTDNVCLFEVHFNLSSSSKKEFDLNCSKFIDEINNILKT